MKKLKKYQIKDYRFWYNATLSMIKHYSIAMIIGLIGTIILIIGDYTISNIILQIILVTYNIFLFKKTQRRLDEEK